MSLALHRARWRHLRVLFRERATSAGVKDHAAEESSSMLGLQLQAPTTCFEAGSYLMLLASAW